MMFLPIFASLLPLSWGLVSAAAVSSPIVDLGYAKYEGVLNSTSGRTQFLGIRYAASPAGKLPFSRNPVGR